MVRGASRRWTAPPPASLPCRRGAGEPNRSRTRAGLHDPAGIHDRHAVACLRHHAQIVGDQDHAHAQVRPQAQQQSQDLILDGDVQCRGRLVGEQQAGRARQRDRDHDALTHAARELVRVVAEARRCGAGCRPGPAARPRVLAGRGARAPVCAFRFSPIWRPTVSTGLSAVIGSWKIMAISRPRSRRSSRSGMADQFAAAPDDRALDAARRSHQAQDRAQGHALARAGFADQSQHLARLHLQIDAVDRGQRAARAWRSSSSSPGPGEIPPRSPTRSQQIGEAIAERG